MTELKTTDEWEPKASLAVFLKFGKHFWNSSFTSANRAISSGNAFRYAIFGNLESLRVRETEIFPWSMDQPTAWNLAGSLPSDGRFFRRQPVHQSQVAG